MVRTIRGGPGRDTRPYVGTFNPDGAMGAVKYGDHVTVWWTSTGQVAATFALPDYAGTAESLQFTADGRRLAFTVEDAVIIETLP